MAGPRAIEEVAASLGIGRQRLLPFGFDKAKVLPGPADEGKGRDSKLILVSAMTPTKAGEGKTSTAIGLGDALAQRGRSVCLALREPSMGPCMGIKGGGTGGGEAQLHPSDDINLHFTGDFHAITAAHNLLSAAVDNHLHFESDLGLVSRRVTWPRVMDVSDRSLRKVVTGLGGATMGMPRETGFEITAASELMAILCLAEDVGDLRKRIDRIVIGFERDRSPVLAEKIGVTGAMLAYLRDALFPNLVQSKHGTPALVHGGPFANIAHGCNSVIATKAALRVADWVVTEAGFGSDLGAEKFFDIKCRGAGLDPAAVVLVATVRALKLHGGISMEELSTSDPDAVSRGLPNLAKHLDNVAQFGKPAVVAINRFTHDQDEEIEVVLEFCRSRGVAAVVTETFTKGPEGGIALAEAVEEVASQGSERFKPVYELSSSIPDKISAVAKGVYGAGEVCYSAKAQRWLGRFEKAGYGGLPICMAKTQASLSDDPSALCRPEGFSLTVRDVELSAGAGFVVVLTGDMLRMPGLPRKPQANAIDLVDGKITNLR